MIVFNFTGLKRVYWLPCLRHKSDLDGLWFWSLRWLGVEVIAYSREMGSAFIYRMNKQEADLFASKDTTP